MTDARVTDTAIEVAVTATDPAARITDTAIEVAVTATSPEARITDTTAEVAVTATNPTARITDTIIEVAMVPGTEITISDPVGITDSRVPTLAVNLTDPVGIVDDADIDIVQVINDSIGIIDQRYQASYRTDFYVYENVGVTLSPSSTAHGYVYENVGVLAPPSSNATFYVYEGNVDTSIPTPHIWFIQPGQGVAPMSVSVVGFGFGTSAVQYNGKLYLGSVSPANQLAVVSWDQIAATADAYTADRVINPLSGEADPQHQTVVVTIPPGASSGNVIAETDA